MTKRQLHKGIRNLNLTAIYTTHCLFIIIIFDSNGEEWVKLSPREENVCNHDSTVSQGGNQGVYWAQTQVPTFNSNLMVKLWYVELQYKWQDLIRSQRCHWKKGTVAVLPCFCPLPNICQQRDEKKGGGLLRDCVFCCCCQSKSSSTGPWLEKNTRGRQSGGWQSVIASCQRRGTGPRCLRMKRLSLSGSLPCYR